MPYEQRPNSGSLFKNRDHAKNPKSPNLRGNALLQLEDGRSVEIEISAWTKESERAGKWLSLSLKVKGESATRNNASRTDPERAFPNSQTDEDISF